MKSKITYYSRFSDKFAREANIPKATTKTITIFTIDQRNQAVYLYEELTRAEKVWVKVDDEPVRIVKADDLNYEFDEVEFAQMLLVSENISDSVHEKTINWLSFR